MLVDGWEHRGHGTSWRRPAVGADIRGALATFDLVAYIEEARASGRAQLSSHIRREACTLYQRICEFRAGQPLIPHELNDVLEFAHRVLMPEWLLSHTGRPRYRTYTNIGVLNWYLGTVQRTPYQEIWARCATAIRLLLHDVTAFEINSLAGLEACNRESFDEDAVRARVMLLRDLPTAFADFGSITSPIVGPPSPDWQSYLSEPGMHRALIYLTSFPLTKEHDEYMFLRTLHISECCFWGILTAALAAIEGLKRSDIWTASKCLDVALPFAEFLTPLLQALKTMTAVRFGRFRDATGAASALQSRTYQLMQITLTGVNPQTIKVLVGIEELEDLKLYDQPLFTTLAHVALSAHDDPDRNGDLLQRLDVLSRELRKWRKVHRGIVRIYLAQSPTGTGGTNGPDYLKHTVDSTIAGVAQNLRSASAREAFGATGDLQAVELWPVDTVRTRGVSRAPAMLTADN